MAKKKKARVPSYCLYKPTNQGYCQIKGNPFFYTLLHFLCEIECFLTFVIDIEHHKP